MADIDVNGTWKGEVDTPLGTIEATLKLEAAGDSLTGTISAAGHELPLLDGEVKGEHVHFKVKAKRGIASVTGKCEAVVHDEVIEGTAKAMGQKVAFKLRRQ